VPALVHLCSSSQSKMARFMAALALAYMFDGRCIYTSSLVPKNTDVHNVLSPVLFLIIPCHCELMTSLLS
jgi:hypothetical protein